MWFAVAAMLSKSVPTGRAMKLVLGTMEASNVQEAKGIFIEDQDEKFPEYSVDEILAINVTE